MDSKTYINQIKSQISEIEPEQVNQKIETKHDFILIDLREPNEIEAGIILDATIIPRGLLEVKINSVAKKPDNEIVLYCAGGVRSALSAKTLKDMGYTNVYSMAGGYQKWKHAGYSIHKKKV